MAERRERVFVVRMWCAGEDRATSAWRGSVRDVKSGRLLYVVGTREVADYIAATLSDDEERR